MTASLCTVCGSGEVSVFLKINQVPVHCNVLWPSRDEAINAPKGDIGLTFCSACGHIFNTAFNLDSMTYGQTYENSLHFSPSFQEYATALAESLIKRYDLHKKVVMEIGCGKGDFLKLLCGLRGNKGIGFDPSYHQEESGIPSEDSITIIPDYYSERYSEYKADIVCCRQVLEHIGSPGNFIASLQRAIESRINTIVFFEVPNSAFTLRDLGIWDIIYEHCSYFSPTSLARLFDSSGFRVLRLEETFGRQYLCIEASISTNGIKNSSNGVGYDLESIKSDVSSFTERHQKKIGEWHLRLEDMKQKGMNAVIWGAGSKGVTFLNTIAGDSIKYVVDINPRKHGMFIPGTGQEIVRPDFLLSYRPDAIIVMNPLYLEEVRGVVDSFLINPDIIPV